MEVPWLDLKSGNAAVKDEVLPLWEEILSTAGFIGGKHVAGFEEEFAAACGTQHCVAVNSGTDSLRFILIALGLQPGDEVIVPVNTFIATSESVSQAGGVPVFCDVDPRTYNLDVKKAEAAITPRTRAIIPVHLYGQPADMEPLLALGKKHGLWIIEDAAQAHLATYRGRMCGSMGVAGSFSFYPGKNLGACGEAGAVTTDDADLAQRVRMLRDHGQAKKYYHDIEGYNGRCDALQCAALRVKLKRLPAWTAARRAHAALYRALLQDAPGVTLPATLPETESSWHLFVVQVNNRDAVQHALQERGVSTALHYPIPLHLQRAYASMNLPEGSFPVAESAATRILTLPMFPELREEEVRHVCDALQAAT